MSCSAKVSNILFVVLGNENNGEKNASLDNCHELRLDELECGRHTYLTSIMKHSNKLMDEFDLAFLDIIFCHEKLSLQKTDLQKLCALLDEVPFICCSGFQHHGKMGIYYDVGAQLKKSNFSSQATPVVDIPVAELSAFRHSRSAASRFQIYDKWNTEKYLDLELALYAKEQGQNFLLVEGAGLDGFDAKSSKPKDKIHKAAIYNELFVKNCFDIKEIHHQSSETINPKGDLLEQNLEIVTSHLDEIKHSNRKLEYVNSKIGNYDVLQYNIQENTKPRYSLKIPFSKIKSDDAVAVSLASIPEREAFLKGTIRSIYKQCDRIYVYLNGYDEIPEFLNRPKIKVYRSQDHGDLSANGKVWFLNEKKISGYVFLIDDDILYPSDYVHSMIATLKKYQHKFAACVHGSIFSDQLRWYYQRSAMFPFRRSLIHDIIVNLPGSGTFAFHTDTLDVSYDDFAPFTMVDLILGIQCKNQSVPIVSVARHHEWLKVQKDLSGRDLWSAFKSVITLHTPTALANGPWDYNVTKSYVLPIMEEIFGSLNFKVIDDNKLDKQFLHSAYKETIPELWSLAGRMQNATENNYQKFLFSVSNDYLDKTFDGQVYDEATGNVKRLIGDFRHIGRKLKQMISECEIEGDDRGEHLQYLSKIEMHIYRTSAELISMDKVNRRFTNKKQKLSNLKRKSNW